MGCPLLQRRERLRREEPTAVEWIGGLGNTEEMQAGEGKNSFGLGSGVEGADADVL